MASREHVVARRSQIMQKVVFINKPITEDLANNMIALTLYLDSLDKKRIYYWLNVPGGEVRHMALCPASSLPTCLQSSLSALPSPSPACGQMRNKLLAVTQEVFQEGRRASCAVVQRDAPAHCVSSGLA